MSLSKPYNVALPEEPSELAYVARAGFLDNVLLLKPHVVTDLWEKVFPSFKTAVVRKFHDEILDGIEDIDQYLASKHETHLCDPKSIYFNRLERELEAVTGALPYRIFEDLTEERTNIINNVVASYVLAFYQGQIVKLIQRKLTTEMGPDILIEEFDCFAGIAHRPEYDDLAKAIKEWANRWNLGAGWCLDHAVIVLREWLSNRHLSSVSLFESPQSIQRAGWISSTDKILFASVFSRVAVDVAVYGSDGPEKLRFQWGNYNFQSDGFNRLRESKSAYKQRMLQEFELYWTGHRHQSLLALHNPDDAYASRPRLEPYTEAIGRFKRVLNEHIRQSIEATAEPMKLLLKGKSKHSLTDHLRWAVDSQVEPTKTLSDIFDFEDLAVAIADGLRGAESRGLTLMQISQLTCLEIRDSADIARACTLLVERDTARAEYDLATSNDGVPLQITRYVFNSRRNRSEAPDPSTISKGISEILDLVGLEKTHRKGRGAAAY